MIHTSDQTPPMSSSILLSWTNHFKSAVTPIHWSILDPLYHHIILYILLTVSLAILSAGIYQRFFHPLARFPGPPLAKYSNAYWYSTILSGRGPWRNHEWHIKWGPVVRIATNHLSFNTHAAQKTIYGFGNKTISSMAKDPIFFTPEVDDSMNIINETDKTEHARMRRMLSSAFSHGNLTEQENEDVLVRRVEEFLARIGDGGSDGKREVDIVREFGYVTFDIMGEMSFGDSFDARIEAQPESRYHWADVIVKTTYMNDVMRAICVIPGLFTLLAFFKSSHMKKTLYRHAEYASEHTEARLNHPPTRKDFMHHMLTSRGPRATEKELASHFNVIMMAGAVTTATFLSGVTYYLSTCPTSLLPLQQELRSRFKTIDEITSKKLLTCEYLNAVIEEGLRIFPPAGAGHLSRIVPEGGCMIDGVWVPGGTRVSVHQWSVLRDERNFSLPNQFIPERWLKDPPIDHKADRLETSLPFSYGPRGCLGRNLAYLEMRMVLAKVFWKFDLEWSNSKNCEVDWERDCKGYTLWEKPELRVILTARAD